MKFDNSPLYFVEMNICGKRHLLFDLAFLKNELAFKKIDFSNSGIPIIKIIIPPKNLQCIIVSILKAIDDQITLNTKINKNLYHKSKCHCHGF